MWETGKTLTRMKGYITRKTGKPWRKYPTAKQAEIARIVSEYWAGRARAAKTGAQRRDFRARAKTFGEFSERLRAQYVAEIVPLRRWVPDTRHS